MTHKSIELDTNYKLTIDDIEQIGGMPESSKPLSGIASRLQLVHDEPTGLIVAVVAAQSNDEGQNHAGSSQRTFRKCVEQLMQGS